jgi:hypothetical protein
MSSRSTPHGEPLTVVLDSVTVAGTIPIQFQFALMAQPGLAGYPINGRGVQVIVGATYNSLPAKNGWHNLQPEGSGFS